LASNVRLAEDDDLVDVRVIERECFPGEAWRVVDAWDRWTWWVAEDDAGDVVAFAAAVVVDGSSTAFLALAGVASEARGRGLQRRLIRVREAWARGRCCSHMVTYTAPHNNTSANNLIRCGYQLYTPAEAWGVDGALYWWRDL